MFKRSEEEKAKESKSRTVVARMIGLMCRHQLTRIDSGLGVESGSWGLRARPDGVPMFSRLCRILGWRLSWPLQRSTSEAVDEGADI